MAGPAFARSISRSVKEKPTVSSAASGTRTRKCASAGSSLKKDLAVVGPRPWCATAGEHMKTIHSAAARRPVNGRSTNSLRAVSALLLRQDLENAAGEFLPVAFSSLIEFMRDD